ncbi:MAG: HAMP domain-containing histidine kinase [Clostridiales bacterium]|nr:HAMP domain-containing histidine kinase [Clostridiales bacterium]
MAFSISSKLFIITSSLIFILLIFSMIFQNLFFEDFYLNKKVKDMIKETKKFSELYSYQVSNENILTEALFRFEQNTNSKIALLSLDGKFKFLPNYDKNSDDFQTLTYFCAELINNRDLLYDVLESGKSTTTIFENEFTKTTKIGTLTPMSLNSFNDSIIVAVSSMHPIREATDVIKEFYIYLFLGFLILGLILTLIYVNLITKPLVKINKVAKGMSNLDFSVKCEVQSDDEIGNLATTLNFLSSSLERSLEDLKQKNIKLQEDIEKERKIEELRKDFVASVSHDLKTPIGIIEGYAEGLRDGIATGKDTDIYLETIIDEAKKMDKLVTNMLELSKLESGTTELLLENFNILRLIQKLIKRFSLEYASKNINLILNTNLEYCYVIGDSFQLDQVMTNLLSNAFKYTNNNEDVIIEINTTESIVEISVENKGAHIPDDEIENLFNKFYKLDKSRSRFQNKNSSGLGLAIVDRILTLHESKFSLLNTEDGVRFTFTLKKGLEPNLEE